ncbi:DiGeorge syndrome critical region protein 14 [Coemansia interrupta]|uniref:DiGeorge syndrome critical region protein 14 n=1 Tax=Coemansia interrupta TaxID=1126814 RepID=A0A9W8HPU8_9FUNG|nr:DiGeorge syndrome critical region protein 14 [Coemansia interrupta]
MNPKSKALVLSEEEYRRGLSQIISRDFFPDLRRLEAENQALQVGSSGSGDITPSVVPPAGEANPQSLDQYLSTYTSSDTASFHRLFDLETAKRQEKRTQLLGARKPNVLHGNQLPPRAARGGAPEARCVSRGRRIVYENTRFGDPRVWDDVDDCGSVAGSDVVVEGGMTPVINGYRMVRSPRGRRGRKKGGEGGVGPAARGLLSPAGRRLLAGAVRGGGAAGSSPARHAASRDPTASGGDPLRRAYNSPYARRAF